jgi:rSAM/selenodomain-associated transferase 2/rSAM/selenodomain-associated transferase 1
MKLGVVIPVWNEGSALLGFLEQLQTLRAMDCRVVMVECEHTHEPRQAINNLVDQIIKAPRGRASQMNAGADALASGNTHWRPDVVLFLHADTALPHPIQAIPQLIAQALARNACVWGRFDVSIQTQKSARLAAGLRVVSGFMNVRSALTHIATGDQAIFVSLKTFQSMGGFAPIALMEDIEWCSRARLLSKSARIRKTVITSGRRWEKNGLFRTIYSMWCFRLAYFFGTSAQDLAQRYGYQPRASAAVHVMGRAPIAGTTKTRLIPLLGPGGAARAHRSMMLKTLGTVRQASIGPCILWCAPDTNHRLFAILSKRFGLRIQSQGPGNIGEKMLDIVQQHFAQGNTTAPMVIVGTDCPSLTPNHFQQLADALDRVDIAIIASHDGGYVALGLRRPVESIFKNIAWSTSIVLEQTIRAAKENNATVQIIDTLHDIDEPADWARYQQQTT